MVTVIITASVDCPLEQPFVFGDYKFCCKYFYVSGNESALLDVGHNTGQCPEGAVSACPEGRTCRVNAGVPRGEEYRH